LDRRPAWTGAGYVRVFEGSALQFAVDNVFVSGNYELVVRYENAQPEAWEDLRISIIRDDGPANIAGVCGGLTDQDDEKSTGLAAGVNVQVVSVPTCLERDKKYTIKLQFVKFSANVAQRDASILIDSVSDLIKLCRY
jgi:hypothetical protein